MAVVQHKNLARLPILRERERERSIANKRPNNFANNGTSHQKIAGVGIVVTNCFLNSLKDVKNINGRIATVTFTSHGYDLTFIYLCLCPTQRFSH